MQLITHNLEETLELGQTISRFLRGGDVIELTSDLGGGKTALTKGIAAGLGVTDTVQSPSFTVSRIYTCTKGRELHHFDFYRLDQPGIMAAELAESLSDEKAIVVVEWSTIVKSILPQDRIRVNIKVLGETSRQFQIELPENMKALASVLVAQFKKESA